MEDFGVTEMGYRTLRTTGKYGKTSVKVIPPPVWQAVERAKGDRTSGPLLLRRDGSRMTRRSADRVVQRTAAKAGIKKKISPHALRRTFATLALRAGVDIRVVQDGLDHADARTVLEYDALGVELHTQASNTVAALLASASN